MGRSQRREEHLCHCWPLHLAGKCRKQRRAGFSAALHCIALHCGGLRSCIAVHCSGLRFIVLHCGAAVGVVGTVECSLLHCTVHSAHSSVTVDPRWQPAGSDLAPHCTSCKLLPGVAWDFTQYCLVLPSVAWYCRQY